MSHRFSDILVMVAAAATLISCGPTVSDSVPTLPSEGTSHLGAPVAAPTVSASEAAVDLCEGAANLGRRGRVHARK